MIILGIDPGTATTGYGIIKKQGQNFNFIECGVISTSSKEDIQYRLKTIYSNLREIIAAYEPQCMAVEKIYFNKNVTTGITESQARGVVLLATADFKIPIYEYTPQQIKNAVTGYGEASKKQVQNMVKVLLNLTKIPKPDDAADALAVALCCGFRSTLNKKDSTA